jgi:phosphatidylglycerophosphate synthase
MARKSYDPINNFVDLTSKPLIKLLSLTALTSVQITLLGFFVCILPAAYLLSTGGYWQGILAVLLAILGSWLDFADGAIARMKKACSPLGAWIDPSIDVVSQAFILVGVIHGAYVSTGSNVWLIIGLLALLGQLAENFIGIEFVHRFGFDSYTGLPSFKEEYEKIEKKNIIDYFLRQTIMPTNILAMFFFTTRYFILLGVFFHSLWFTVLSLALILNLRWIISFILFAIYLKPGKSDLAVVEALKKIKK